MKNIKKVVLFTIIFVGNIVPMHMTDMGKKAAKSKAQFLFFYFIYSMETSEGIWIGKKVAEENSEYIKMMRQRNKSNEIGLPFSIEPIKLAFNILTHPTDLHNLSLEQLISVIVVFDFLEIPSDTMKIVLEKTKKDIEKNSEISINERLKELPDYIAKLLLIDLAVSYLRECIVDFRLKYVNSIGGGKPDRDYWQRLEQHNLFLQQVKSYNGDQVRLVYQLCFQSLQGETIQLQSGSEDQKIFNTLPQNMQSLLTDLFDPFSSKKELFSGWL